MRSEILNSHVEWHPEERDSDATLKETSQSTASIFSVVDTRKTRWEAVSQFVVNVAYLRYKRVSNDTYVRTSRRPQDVCVTYPCTNFPRENRCSSLLWTVIHVFSCTEIRCRKIFDLRVSMRKRMKEYIYWKIEFCYKVLLEKLYEKMMDINIFY